MPIPHTTNVLDHEGEGQATGSKKYLPENLHGIELYDEVCDWIDHVLAKGEIEHDFLILDDLVTQLITIFKDKGALAAYYNLFVRSIIGTQSALNFLMDLLEFTPKGDWEEWHELVWPLPPYKLILNFGDTYPHHKDPSVKYVDWDKLLDLFALIKNERTLIAQVRMKDCANMLIFDYGGFDFELFDNLQGYIYRGVRFCLYEKHRQILYENVNFITHFHEMRTTYHSRFWQHSFAGALDYMYLDEPYWYYLHFYRFETHLYFQKIDADITETSPYHWGTWVCQIVLDEYEELDNGAGFPGDVLRIDTFYLSGDETLDGVVGEWVSVGCEFGYTAYFLDFSTGFPVSWGWFSGHQRMYTIPSPDPLQINFYQMYTCLYPSVINVECQSYGFRETTQSCFLDMSSLSPTIHGYHYAGGWGDGDDWGDWDEFSTY